MTDDERLARGKAIFQQTYGDVVPYPEKLNAFSENSIKNLFGEIYAREGLSSRDRRLLVLGAIAGLGADASLFEVHARSGLNNGEIQYDELQEICLMLVNYCGYPQVAPLSVLCEELIAEKDSAPSP